MIADRKGRDPQSNLVSPPPPTPTQDPKVALCPGTYGDPMGVSVFVERGTTLIPVCEQVEWFKERPLVVFSWMKWLDCQGFDLKV